MKIPPYRNSTAPQWTEVKLSLRHAKWQLEQQTVEKLAQEVPNRLLGVKVTLDGEAV